MSEDFTLSTFYTSWKSYQDRIKGAIAPLTADQLELRAAPHLRSIGENVLHIISCRAGWFTHFLGEDFGVDVKAYADWDDPGAPSRTSDEIVSALDHTWRCMAECLERWSSDDMKQTFPDDWNGKQVHLSRAWVVYHVMEHDIHHGGELSFTFGIYEISADFPG
jgi:uncharacterized damage-inducible protein DinB